MVDTPPSRDALAFLEAPDRITDFVAARLLSWLAGPSRVGLRAMNFAATPFLRIADRLLGSEVLEELGAFVRDLQALYGGVRQRAEVTSALLRSRSTAFAVVTSLEPPPLAEAEFFARELRRKSLPLRALVVNRVLPEVLRDAGGVAAATALAHDEDVSRRLATTLGERVAADVPRRLGRAFLTLNLLAERDAAHMARLGDLGRVPVARLPLADRDVSDLEALGELTRWLQGEA